MSKVKSVILVLLLVVLTTGCGEQLAAPTATPTPAPTPTPLPSPTAAPVAPGATTGTPTRPATCVPEPFDPPVVSGLPPVTDADHVYGSANASITLIEYADFQCPGCAAMHTLRTYLEEAYGDDLRYVYRHFPLSFHPLATIAAEAAEAAGAQGKFWEMHDMLFEHQQEWSQLTDDTVREKFVEYASELGLDTERFAQELDEHKYLDKVNADTQSAMQANLGGTPTYIVNGVAYPSQWGLHPALVVGFINLLQLKDRMYTSPPEQVIDPGKEYTATIRTERGDIVVKLYASLVPVTVNSFVFLAREGWYDGVSFHRVIPGFVAQTGDPTGIGIGSPGYRCDDEIVPSLRYDKPGVVGMASQGPGTSSVGSQFFITYAALPQLDGNYTIIGQVVRGMEVVEKLSPRDPAQDPTAPPGDKILTIVIEEK
ncbi:MAG: peptidylprolyl isomerase [Anaerolineae bacterium]|nr:peptidylprolyl isomerase [Anaerolineae bacterium]